MSYNLFVHNINLNEYENRCLIVTISTKSTPIPTTQSIPLVLSLSLLTPLATNAPRQLDILWHDSHTLSVNSTKIGILEKSNKVGLGRFLKSQYGRSLEAKVAFEILGYFTY